MVASGATLLKPAIQASMAACCEVAPAPAIVPDASLVAALDSPPPDGAAASLAAPQPASSIAPLAATPTAASRAREPCRRVFTCVPPYVGSREPGGTARGPFAANGR